MPSINFLEVKGCLKEQLAIAIYDIALPANEQVMGVVDSVPLAYMGSIIGRMVDERVSYKAGDENFARFAQAVHINHDVFQARVLGIANT